MNSSRGYLYALILFVIPITAALMFPFAGGAAPEGKKQTPSQRASVRELPNFDALAGSAKRSASTATQNSVQYQVQPQSEGGHLIQYEPRLGVPTFLWASESDRGPAMSQRTAADHASQAVQAGQAVQPDQAGRKTGGFESIARVHLSKYASRYRLSAEDIENAQLASVHDTGQGPIIVKLKRQVGGVEVFRDEVRIIMDREMRLIAISGYITGGDDSAVPAFSLQSTDAITRALNDLTGSTINQSTLKRTTKVAGSGENQDQYQYFTAGKDQTPGFVLDDLVRARQVMYHLVDQYIPSYYIETNVLIPVPDSSRVDLSGNPQTDWVTQAYSYVISAVDGQILFRKNLTQNDAYTYRVFADPTTRIPYDSPAGNAVDPKIVASPDGVQYPFLSPNDITLQNYPFSRNDPWLPPGATETIGNNVDAYVDLFNPDGLNPAGTPSDPATADFRALITAPGQFLHTHTPDADPKLAEARQGTIQQLFYNVNFLHDWYYEAGFDEASGNAQASNYGRGGVENDRLRAEGQDVSGKNTSNMLTPADGTSPRMQMFLFDPNEITYVDVLSPEAAAGQRGVGTATVGPQAFDLTNEVVQPNPASGCTAASFAGTAGKFVMVDRQPTSGGGACSIGAKLTNAMAAGAAGFILVNVSTSPNDVVSVSGSLPTFTIPFLSISWNGAASIKTELAAANTVTVRMRRDFALDRDGGVDNQGVFHEWGHYLSNRLIGNSAGLVPMQSQGMGEGWGDFNALLLTVRQEDATVASNLNFNGTYALSTYVASGGNNNGYYFGNRRYPYSTDMTRNPLTLKHIRDGESLPVGPPRNSAISTNNAAPHNTGEVWATMLWECYASLLRDTQGASPRLTFQEAQTRMKYYLVASLKTTPNSPTFLDGRDALLAAAYATDQVDYQHFWAAFAKRGAGFGAVITDRFTFDNSGVTESFSIASDAGFTGASLDDGVTSCDQDGIIDSGETGHLTLNLRNIGLNTLTGTTGTVTSSTPGVTLSNGGNVTFASFNPGSSASASIDVTLATGIAGVQSLDFQLTYNDPQFATPHTVSFSFRGNSNLIPASTATDAVETGTNGWTATSVPPTVVTGGVTLVVGVASPFTIKEVNSLQHVWHVDDIGTYTDERLTSPVFTVDGGGSFNLQFDHSWGFEFDGGGNYDGGVVEMSVNGGAWFDIGGAAYNGTLINGGSGNPNPLRGRTGFVQNSGGTIHTSLTQAVAPGATLQVRFREGSDFAIGGTGWDIDNITFTGVVETPFTTLVADQSSCPGPTPTPVTLQLTPNTLPAGSVTLAYPTTVLTASGGSAPYTYSLTPFGLPPGLVRDVVGGNLQISGTPTLPGTYPVTIVVNDSAGHQKTFNYSITINRLDPNVAWSNPPDITFGTALGGTQLNATAGVPGTFNYTPTDGTVLNASNSQTLSVNFVPTDTNYISITKSVTINVMKATPNITWANPADITYGTALSGTQLNASASVPGVLTYSLPSGTVLNAGYNQLLSVDFVPTDTTNFNDTAKNVLINVLKVTPDITWNPPADIVYGTALSATQLNASASVPGILTYDPAATTVLNAGNVQRLSVSFVPTDTANYNNHSLDVPINVTKASQTITFGALSTRTFGDADFNVSATASSNLTVEFAATGNCSVSGSTVHLTGTGSCTITASQGGDNNYDAATDVPQTFVVGKANQTIAFGALPAKTLGDADFNVSATATSNLIVSFAATGSCTINGNTVHLTATGSCTITASQGGDTNYNAAASVGQTFAVDKASQTITFDALLAKTFSDADFNVSATASSNLTVSFAATGSCTVSGNIVRLTGAGSCMITASQGGNNNYNAAANVVQTFAVSKGNQTITFAALSTKTYANADFNVSATASSNLTVSFAATGSCSINGNTVHLTGAGSCTITASQSGDSNYNAAANVGQTFAVEKANQTITFGALPAKTFGDADFNVSATSSSNLTVSLVATGNCTVSGNSVHLTGFGSCTITASQIGDINYNAAADVPQTFSVAQVNAAPTANNDTLGNIAEDSSPRVIPFADLTANDSKGAANEIGQTLTVISTDAAVGGLVTIVPGFIVFTPNDDYNGPVSFNYVVQDNGSSNGLPDPKTSGSATVQFHITEVNDAPAAVNDTLPDLAEDSAPQVIPSATLTANDSRGPANENNQTLIAKTVSNAIGGGVSIIGGNVVFTPTADYSGSASFDYTVEDNGASNGAADPRTSGTATARFNIIALADTPSVTNATTDANTQTTSGLVISRNPADGPEVTHFRITAITGGSLFTQDGITLIHDGDFITFAEGNAGLKFTPGASNGSFMVQSSTSASNTGLQGGMATATITVNPVVNPVVPVLRFSSNVYSVSEGAGFRTITVERTGDTSQPVTVDYVSSDHSSAADFLPCTSAGDGFASSRCDFTTAIGTLRFAAGETSRTFNLLINEDNYVEGPEMVELTLFNPTAGAELGAPSTATVEITDDVTEGTTNPVDTSVNFVTAQYHDVLNREPDAPGLAFWTDNIERCKDPARRPAGLTLEQCVDKQRESTAIAFFMSPEFQMTGGFVFRLYKGSLPGFPNFDGSGGRYPTALQFVRDLSQVSEGIVVNNRIDGAVVEANRSRLVEEFVLRPEFDAKYGGLNNSLYVEELLNTTGISQEQLTNGGPNSMLELKQELVEGLTRGTETRGSVLRKIVDGTVVISEDSVQFTTPYGQAFYEQEYQRMFVYMEYVGYLRRNPDAAGFVFWLGKMNHFGGDPFQAEMVRSFILSPEYRSRFGQP